MLFQFSRHQNSWLSRKVILALFYKDCAMHSHVMESMQVIAAGDLCAICQEKMHAPILLRCKHIFCEDCVSEWFERERTCPLCRALVKPADLRSFGDGSTSLFFQFFQVTKAANSDGMSTLVSNEQDDHISLLSAMRLMLNLLRQRLCSYFMYPIYIGPCWEISTEQL